MYSIGKLCREFNLSRSTLLYYDSIGLLKASKRTASNYRIYSDEDRNRLNKICSFREAGVPLEHIKELLDSKEVSKQEVLEKRLYELNNEIRSLRLQQKIIVKMLKSSIGNFSYMMDKSTFVTVLKTSGLDDELMGNLHAELEKVSPLEHQIFLEFLGIPEEEIKNIREHARSLNK